MEGKFGIAWIVFKLTRNLAWKVEGVFSSGESARFFVEELKEQGVRYDHLKIEPWGIEQ